MNSYISRRTDRSAPAAFPYVAGARRAVRGNAGSFRL